MNSDNNINNNMPLEFLQKKRNRQIMNKKPCYQNVKKPYATRSCVKYDDGKNYQSFSKKTQSQVCPKYRVNSNNLKPFRMKISGNKSTELGFMSSSPESFENSKLGELNKLDVQKLLKENADLLIKNNDLTKQLSHFEKSNEQLKKELQEKTKINLAAFCQAKWNTDQINQCVQNVAVFVDKTMHSAYTTNLKLAVLEARNEKLEYVNSCLWIRDIIKAIFNKLCGCCRIEIENLNEYTLLNKANLDILAEKFGLEKVVLFEVFKFLKCIKETCNNIAHTGNKYPLGLLDNKKTLSDFYSLLTTQFALRKEIATNMVTLLNKFNFTIEDVRKK
jgi:hypothetical protein